MEGADPYALPDRLARLIDPAGHARSLTTDGVTDVVTHAMEAATLAVNYNATVDADDAAWLLLASAGYAEAVQLMNGETLEPGEHASPQVILAAIKNADRCCALGGRSDIRIHHLLRHLVPQHSVPRTLNVQRSPAPSGFHESQEVGR